MIIKDDTIFRFICCTRTYQDRKLESDDFPIIEREYTLRELKETGNPFYSFLQQVVQEEREKISSEAEKEANKFILEKN